MSDATAYAICFLALLLPTQTSKTLLKIHNSERSDKSVDSLELDESLCSYAQKHAENMAKKGRLTHSSMSDLSVLAGTGSVAENIAWGQATEEEVMASWMNSSGHKQNIMSPRFKKVGFGAKEDSRGRLYWCAVFSG